MSRITRKVLINQKNMTLLKYFVRPIACTAGKQGYIKTQNMKLRHMFKSLQEQEQQFQSRLHLQQRDLYVTEMKANKFPFFDTR